MDFDINNHHMLSTGAYYQSAMKQHGEWQPISTAPKDGTIIEVRCTYGVAPWYGLYRWTTVRHIPDQSGQLHEWHSDGGWVKVGDEQLGFTEGSSFTWRQYGGNGSAYVDPTGGAQNSPAYWRGAVAAKYGLPLNAFERQTKENIEGKPWWKFW